MLTWAQDSGDATILAHGLGFKGLILILKGESNSGELIYTQGIEQLKARLISVPLKKLNFSNYINL